MGEDPYHDAPGLSSYSDVFTIHPQPYASHE